VERETRNRQIFHALLLSAGNCTWKVRSFWPAKHAWFVLDSPQPFDPVHAGGSRFAFRVSRFAFFEIRCRVSSVSHDVRPLIAVLLLAASIPLTAAPPSLAVDRAKGEVHVRAIVQPGAMERWFGVQGHHAVVWDGGKAARWALFRALASDHDVRVALDSLGAKRGENLTVETWTERDNPESPEPDKRVEGTPIEVLVAWNGRAPVPLASLLRQKKAAAAELDFRYGGHETLQATFHSGCIVCLYSCPGGAVSNHSRTIRDYERGGVIYVARPEALPPDGSEVTIILRPKLEAR
jgi:hypothetical protein